MDNRLLEQWGSLVATRVMQDPRGFGVHVTVLQAAALADAIVSAVEACAAEENGGSLLRRALSARPVTGADDV